MTIWQVSTLELSSSNPSLVGMEGCAYDGGRYVYFIPHDSHIIARVDVATFQIADPVADTLDLNLVAQATGHSFIGFLGCFIAGGYLYLLPHATGAFIQTWIVRVDLNNFTQTGVSWVDMTLAGLDATTSFSDGCTDGTWGYLGGGDSVSGGQGALLRFGLGSNFDAAHITIITDTTGPRAYGTLQFDGSNLYAGYGTAGGAIFGIAKIDPTNFGLSGITRGPNLGFPAGPFIDDGTYFWGGLVFNGFNQVFGHLIQVNKSTLALVNSWDLTVPLQLTSSSVWNPEATYDGQRYGYFSPSTGHSIALVIDTHNPGAYETFDLAATDPRCAGGGYQCCTTGGEFIYLSPFAGNVGTLGLAARIKLKAVPPPPPSSGVWVAISSPVTPAADEIKDTTTGVILTDETGLPVLADLPATVWTVQ